MRSLKESIQHPVDKTKFSHEELKAKYGIWDNSPRYRSKFAVDYLMSRPWYTGNDVKRPANCKLSEEELEAVIKVTDGKPVTFSKTGMVEFNFTSKERIVIYRLTTEDGKYRIYRCAEGPMGYTSDLLSHDVVRNADGDKYFDTFEEMLEAFEKEIKKPRAKFKRSSGAFSPEEYITTEYIYK